MSLQPSVSSPARETVRPCTLTMRRRADALPIYLMTGGTFSGDQFRPYPRTRLEASSSAEVATVSSWSSSVQSRRFLSSSSVASGSMTQPPVRRVRGAERSSTQRPALRSGTGERDAREVRDLLVAGGRGDRTPRATQDDLHGADEVVVIGDDAVVRLVHRDQRVVHVAEARVEVERRAVGVRGQVEVLDPAEAEVERGARRGRGAEGDRLRDCRDTRDEDERAADEGVRGVGVDLVGDHDGEAVEL